MRQLPEPLAQYINDHSINITFGELEKDLIELETFTAAYQALEKKLFNVFLEKKQDRLLIAALAYEFLAKGKSHFTHAEVVEFLGKMGSQKEITVLSIAIKTGLIKEGEQQHYQFIDSTIQQYYAAIHVANILEDSVTNANNISADRQSLQDQVLKQKLNSTWQRVWWFVAGLLQDNQMAYEHYMGLLQGKVGKESIALNPDLMGQYELGLLAKCCDEARRETRFRHTIEKWLQQTVAQWFNLIKSNLIGRFYSALPEGYSPTFIQGLRLSLSWQKQSGEHDLFCRVTWVEKVDENVSIIGGLRLASPIVVNRLVGLLSDRKSSLQHHAASRALGKLGSAAAMSEVLTDLTRLLSDENWGVQYTAAQALRDLGSTAATPEVLALLTRSLSDEKINVRSNAICALMGLGPAAATPKVLEGLTQLLSDKNWHVQYDAVMVLGNLGSAAATPKVLADLTQLLSDEDKSIRSRAAWALGGLGPAAATPEVLAHLTRLLSDEEKNVRSGAAWALGHLGSAAATPKVLGLLTRLLNDKEGDVQSRAAEALGGLGPAAATPEVLAALTGLLSDEDVYVRLRAALSLRNLGSTAAMPKLLEGLTGLLSDKDRSIRSKAAWALERLGPAAATPEVLAGLTGLLSDEDVHIRSNAAEALGKLGPAAIEILLLYALDECRNGNILLIYYPQFLLLTQIMSISALVDNGLTTLRTILTKTASIETKNKQIQRITGLFIVLFYSNARLQIQWDSINKNYYLLAFDNQSEFQTALTPEEARFLRRLLPRVMASFLDNKFSDINIQAEMQSWPTLENDAYLAEREWIAEKKRIAEEKRLAEEKRIAEEKRLAEEKRQAELAALRKSYVELGVIQSSQANNQAALTYLLTLPETNLNVHDVEDEKTPLMHAIERGYFELVNWLLSQPGIQINKISLEGKTALHYAVEKNNVPCVKSVLEKGADVSIQDSLDKTALDIAKDNKYGPIAGLLQRAAKQVPIESKADSSPSNVSSTPTTTSPSHSSALSSSPAMVHQALREIVASTLTYGKEIGHGAYGTVYHGQWHLSEVAIKKLTAGTLTEKAMGEFKQEAKLMQSLQSPHVVQFFGVCTEPGHTAMVMEYLAKGSLFNLLHSKEDLSWPIRYRFSMDIGVGLAYLHQNNLLHRDLKSQNVLVTDNYRAKLTDFGLAKVKKEIQSKSTTSNAAAGTLLWMAPELFTRGNSATWQSDVYSYGVTMWEICSRKTPFEDAQTPEVAKDWVRDGERETIPTATPKPLAELIGLCWDARAGRRPTAEAAARKLQEERPVEYGESSSSTSSDSKNDAPSFIDNFGSQ